MGGGSSKTTSFRSANSRTDEMQKVVQDYTDNIEKMKSKHKNATLTHVEKKRLQKKSIRVQKVLQKYVDSLKVDKEQVYKLSQSLEQAIPHSTHTMNRYQSIKANLNAHPSKSSKVNKLRSNANMAYKRGKGATTNTYKRGKGAAMNTYTRGKGAATNTYQRGKGAATNTYKRGRVVAGSKLRNMTGETKRVKKVEARLRNEMEAEKKRMETQRKQRNVLERIRMQKERRKRIQKRPIKVTIPTRAAPRVGRRR